MLYRTSISSDVPAHGPDRHTQVLEETYAILHSISPQDEEKVALRSLLELRGREAQYRLDILQTIADSPQRLDPRVRFLTLKTIFRLSQESQQYPRCYVIRNLVLGKRIARGAYGELRKGKIAIGGNSYGFEWPSRTDYAVKVIGLFPGVIDIGDCLREAILWRQFRHPNVLPFLGMYYKDETREDVCFVSPFMNNGSLLVMLRDMTPSQEDMYTLVHDIASGLKYLHDENVIHGDLKPDNVLITDHSRACLCDFGLSRLASTRGFQTTRHPGGGTPGFMAFEVLTDGRTSKRSDVYSFGRLCYEILKKMYNLPSLRWSSKDSPGIDPARPEGLTPQAELMWGMILQCLDKEPSLRPNAEKLVSLVDEMSPMKIEPAPDWDDMVPLFTQVTSEWDYSDPRFTEVQSNVDRGDISLQFQMPMPRRQVESWAAWQPEEEEGNGLFIPPVPEVPQRPAWRRVTPRRRRKNKETAPPPPPPGEPIHGSQDLQSWATWQPPSRPPSVESILLVPDRYSPGLFGPRSPRASPRPRLQPTPPSVEPTPLVPDRDSPGLRKRDPETATADDKNSFESRLELKVDHGDTSLQLQMPVPRRQVHSWATWQPPSRPPSVEPTTLVPDRGSPGLFGPRSPRASPEPTILVPDRGSPGLFGPRSPISPR